MKLVRPEPETDALERALVAAERTSSAVLCVEGVRAAARAGPEFAIRAEAGLRDVSLVPVDAAVLSTAARLAPAELRSLDAVHLATALRVGGDDLVFYAYDRRLADAARAHGLEVRSPGQAA